MSQMLQHSTSTPCNSNCAAIWDPPTLREGTWVISDEGFRMTFSSNCVWSEAGGTKWASCWCWSDWGWNWTCWSCICCDAAVTCCCFIWGPPSAVPCITDLTIAGWVGSKAEFSVTPATPWLAVAAVAAAAMEVAKAFGIRWLWRVCTAKAVGEPCGGGEVVRGVKDVDPTPNRDPCPGGTWAELLLVEFRWPGPGPCKPPELLVIFNCGWEGCFNKSLGDSL